MSSCYNERWRRSLRSSKTNANAKTPLYKLDATLRGKKAKGVPIVTEGPVQTSHISNSMGMARFELQQKMKEIEARERNHESVAPLSCTRARRSVAERLADRFGFGQCRRKREEFYKKIESIAETHGERAMAIISDCVYAAEKADRPGQYFCAAVVRRLKENGFEYERTSNDW